MEKVERQNDLGRIEARMTFRKLPLPLHVKHKIATADELDDEAEPVRQICIF